MFVEEKLSRTAAGPAVPVLETGDANREMKPDRVARRLLRRNVRAAPLAGKPDHNSSSKVGDNTRDERQCGCTAQPDLDPKKRTPKIVRPTGAIRRIRCREEIVSNDHTFKREAVLMAGESGVRLKDVRPSGVFIPTCRRPGKKDSCAATAW